MYLPLSVKDKLDRNLHKQINHPLEITKRYVYKYFDSLGRNFVKYEDCSKIVTVEDNFDSLLIPKDHPARKPSDSFYLSKDTLLRTHTTAHQNKILLSGERNFLITGDVYRRDTVDKWHYPLFHQIEGVTDTIQG